MGKRIVTFALLFLMLGVAFAPVVFDNDKVFVSAFPENYTTYRKIDINASPYISADVNAVPILIKFDSTSHSDMFGTGEDGDSIMFTSDSDGVTQLKHECLRYSDTNATFYVKVNLDNDSQYTPIYVWYGYPDATGTESASNVWTNAVAIYHFEADGTDSSGNSRNVSNNRSDPDYTQTGVVGGGVRLDGNDAMYSGNTTIDYSSGYSIIGWAYPTSLSAEWSWIYQHSSSGVSEIVRFNYALLAMTCYSGGSFRNNSSDKSFSTNTWAMFGLTHNGTNVVYYKNADTPDTNSYTYLTGTSTGAIQVGSTATPDNFYSGILDEIWVFSDIKSDNFYKSIYNNVQNYSTFISIDGAVTSNTDPNKASVIYFGTDTNATETIYDEDSGLGFQITAKITNSSDPDGDNQWFALLVDDNSDFSSVYYNSSYKDDPVDLNMSVTRDMERKKIWYARVDNIDGNGGTNSSDIFKVTLGNHAPNTVTHTSPADSSSTRDTTPTFNWTLASPEDSDGENVYYALYVIDGELNVDYNSGFKDGNVTATATELDIDDYTWKIVSKDMDVNANYIDETNSTAWNLSVVANSAPGTPVITSVGGVTDVNGTVYDEQTGTSAYLLNLKGYNSSDPDGDNMSHRWSWATDYATLFTTTDSNTAWLDNPADINSSTITSALTRNAYWYIGLESKDDYADAKTNTFWKVLVENRVPSKPVITAPSGEYYITPDVTWSASTDGDGDDFNYCVVIKDSLDNIDVNSTYLSSVTSPYTPTPLDYDTYTVYVYVYDGWDTNVSEVGNFSLIENSPPNKATIVTIGGVATGNDMYDEDTGAGFKLTMDGTNSSDYDGDAQQWAWIVDDDSGFGSIDYNSTYATPIDINWTTALEKNKTWYFRVDAIDPAGSGTANSSATFTGTMENYAPNAVTLSTPADSSETYDKTPEFTWSLATPEDADGDNVYYAVLVYDSGDVLDYNSGFIDGAVNANATALDIDTYTWKVVAYDNDGTYYYDKTNSSVRTLTIIENTIPNKPTITSIGGETTNSTIYDEDSGATFQITVKGYNSSDYDGDNQTFKWEVDDNADFGSPEITVTDIESDINATLTDVLTKKVDYYFRLGAKDPLGANDYNYSSPIFKMTLGNRYPSKPVVTAPLTTTYDTTPAISWTNSSDTDGDTLQYRVEISNSSGIVRQSAYGVSQPYTNATALDVGDYNITITAYDGYDTNASANELFTVIANTNPNKPTITTIGGEANASTIYDEDSGATFQITLHGYNASDYDGDTQNFKWDVDDDSDFSSVLFTVDTLGSGDINSTMTTALTKNAYYWFRLGAIDPAGANDYNYSPAFYMYLENKAPTAGTLSSPADASTTYDTTPTFEWTAGSDDDGDTVTKQVKVYDASGNLDYNNTFGSDLTTTSGVLELGTYTWRVRYYDGYDYTNSSDYTLTIIENTAPNKAVITTVAGEANASIIYDQDLTAGFKIVLNGTNSSDPDGDAQKWAWIVDDNADFGSIDYNSGYVTPIDYDWTTALTKNKVWYFRVDAIDPSGSGTYNSSGMYKYTLNNKAPTAGTLSSPTDASTTYDTTPTFEWGAGSDDDGDTLTMQVKVYDASGNLDYNNTLGALTTATPAGALDLGVYTWRVRYYDGYAYTNSSDFTFTLIANTPPNKPTITLIGGSDTNGSTIYDIDATSNFLIYLKGYNSSDPDGDDQSFGWLIDDDGAFGSPAYDTRWFAGHGDINASMTTALPKKTWYYFRLDAKDPLGSDTVNSSVIRKHYVGNYVPTMPVVTAPTTTTSDTTPAITWTNSSDTDGDALTYRVEISNASGVVRQSAWGVSQPYTNTTALDYGDYNITVYVYDTYDTNTSVVESFEVIAVAPPTMPTLTYPEAWAIRVLGTTHMNWTDSTDPEGDPFTYTMYIESQAMTGQYIIKDGLTTSDYNAGDLDLLECHTYRWKVKSVQTDDNSTLGYTDWSYFQVDCTDIYEIKIQSAFNSGTDKVDVIMWLEKNGQIMTDVSVPSIVMKDYANTTVTTLNAGTIYSDGIYRDTYTITGTEAGLYTLKGTLTYNEIVYYGVGVFDANTKEIRDLIEALVVGSGADQYEVRTSASYDETSGTVEVISWIQKNGVQMTGISSVSVVMKDEANTTLHNFNDGTVYTDGFYRATWTATGLHGLYSLRTTLTYSGNTYYGGSHFDAGIMELFDALDTMTTTINTIEANVSSALTYIGDPADTASDSTLFGYGQFIKDKWGTYTAEQIYNKVVDVYNIAVDSNSTSADVLTALSDLDTYVTTYMGVDIRTSASYSFVNDELQIAVAYIQDGAIKDTTSCTLVIKDTDGTTLKTFTDAEDVDHIYRYEWNTSAVDFPANGLTGLYTLIPSVVYNGGTFTTVSHFSAEMPDVYGTTTYTAVVTPYRDSGYSVSVVGDSITEGEYLYVKGVDATMPDTASATVYIYWEDVSNAVLSTTTTTGTIDTGVLRVQAMTPSSVTDTDHVRLVATKTDYGHHTVTMSGVSGAFSVSQKAVGSGLGSPVTSLEIRSTPVLQSGKKVDIAVLADASRPATCEMVLRLSKGSVVVSEEKYTATLVSGSNPLMLSFPVPNADTGSYSMALTDGFRVRDTEPFELVGGKSFWSVFEFEWKVPGTNIIISTK